MKIKILVVLSLMLYLPSHAQQVDSLLWVELDDVVVVAESLNQQLKKRFAVSTEVADAQFLKQHFTGNLMQTLAYVPGVRSMDVGLGFSKPMIRGMGFNRIVVSENGVKQEGQQWGADHGLEVDAFNTTKIVVHKGPQALQYGSDAMGGAIEILPPTIPFENSVVGEVALLGKSVNDGIGASVMLGVKKNRWFWSARYTEQHSGDYRVPTDSIVYLTQHIPIYNRRLKNTAGIERNINLFSAYQKGPYSMNIAWSNVYQKVGFFPGAHGIPDASSVVSDGNSRNIELPYSRVNHFKVVTNQHLLLGSWHLSLAWAYQNNHREEWSRFHTHYGDQLPPTQNPDKELDFDLDTHSFTLKASKNISDQFNIDWGLDGQLQFNKIGGYSFLLPKYKRQLFGAFSVVTWSISENLKLIGGLRYDYGHLDVSGYQDEYLPQYLANNGYTEQEIDAYKWRSYPLNRHFSDYSGSLGMVWNFGKGSAAKVNMGRSFRLPGVNELASNGVHHGTFRHELGDANLQSERGWQLDASYEYEANLFRFAVSPYVNWFSNFIYLRPTGAWSILPHAGQIYQYTGSKVLLSGVEADFSIELPIGLGYNFSGEYIYTQNRDEKTALNFSPPAVFRNTISYRHERWFASVELNSILKQTRVAKNEQTTDGAQLLNLNVSYKLPIMGDFMTLSLAFRNLFNTKYFNHLSFYRKVEIPEPGRNIQLSIHVPLNFKIK